MLLYPERRCSTCTESNKQKWGCQTKLAVPLQFDGEDLWHCPLRPYYDDPQTFGRLFEAVGWLDQGLLPDPGQWPDQSSRLLTLAQIVQEARSEANKVKVKRGGHQ